LKLKVSCLISCLILFTLLAQGCSPYHGMTEGQAEQLISRELPPGSDASQVFTFLDARGLEHSELMEMPPETLARPDNDSFFRSPKLDGRRERVRSYVAAKIPDVDWGLLTKMDIFLRFYFDSDGKLVAHQAMAIGTGP
jgi:hypothetical protein